MNRERPWGVVWFVLLSVAARTDLGTYGSVVCVEGCVQNHFLSSWAFHVVCQMRTRLCGDLKLRSVFWLCDCYCLVGLMIQWENVSEFVWIILEDVCKLSSYFLPSLQVSFTSFYIRIHVIREKKSYDIYL